jgi:hypothetical protein
MFPTGSRRYSSPTANFRCYFPDNRKSLRRFIIWIEKFESAIQKGGKIYAKSVNVHSAALWSMGSGADLNLFTNV